METDVPEVLWTPDAAAARSSAIAQFARFVRERRLVQEQRLADVDELDYPSLHAWSVDDLEGSGRRSRSSSAYVSTPPPAALGSRAMPGTEWFPGATLNYAEHALTDGPGRAGDDLAVVFAREDGLERLVNHGELRDLVGRLRAGLVRLGVGRGDRVVALMPNCVETLAAFPGGREPRCDLVVVLTRLRNPCRARPVRPAGAVSFPRGGRIPLRREGVRHPGPRPGAARAAAHARQTVLLPYLDDRAELAGTLRWAELTAEPRPTGF